MNNNINNISNVSFNARYLNVKQMEKLPVRVSDAIYRSKAIDEFIAADTPKTLWEKFVDLFRKDEIINVHYETRKGENKFDPYNQIDTLSISMITNREKKLRTNVIQMVQNGEKREQGVVPKPGEHPIYKAPSITAEDKIVCAIENIKTLFVK